MIYGLMANIGVAETIILVVGLLATIMTLALVIRDLLIRRLEILDGIIIIVATIFVLGPFGLVLYYVMHLRNKQKEE